MGTYGTTHVKSNNKVIDLTDSHDGYWSGMGAANLNNIRNLTDSQFKRWFDGFTEIINDEKGLEATRGVVQKRDVLNVLDDSQNEPETLDYLNESFSNLRDIRASSSGFAILLALNVNPGHTNSDVPGYLVDLDQKKFFFDGIGIKFSDIRSCNEVMFNHFCENGIEILDEKVQPQFEELQELYYTENKTAEQETKLQNLIVVFEELLIKELYASPEKIKQIDEVAKAGMAAYEKMRDDYRGNTMIDNGYHSSGLVGDDESSHLATINSLPRFQYTKVMSVSLDDHALGNILAYIRSHPQKNEILKITGWGLGERGAGFEIRAHENKALSDILESELASKFGIGFNIYTSTGSFLGDEEPELSAEEKMCDLTKAKMIELGWQSEFDCAARTITIHLNHDEKKKFVLENDPALFKNFGWLLEALRYRDSEMLNHIGGTLVHFIEEANKVGAKKPAKTVLEAWHTGKTIEEDFGDGKTNDVFESDLKNFGIVDFLAPHMNSAEKKAFGLSTPKKKM